MTHLEFEIQVLAKRKGRESNWQFDSQPLKVKNRPDFLKCRWRATHCWKAFDKGYDFPLNLITIGGLHAKLWGPKVAKIPTLVISGVPFGSPKTKSHLDVGFAERYRVYYMGEGGGFPQVWAVVSLVSPRSPMALPSTKNVLTTCWLILCRFV
jgi:hypothetical protein